MSFAVAIALVPLLARVYSPEAFGSFGLFFTYFVSVSGLVGLRFDAAIIAARDDGEARALAVLAISSAVLVTILATAVLWWLITAALFESQSLPIWSVPAMFVALMLVAVFSTLRYVLYYLDRPGTVAKAILAQSTSRGVGQLLIGFVSPTAGALIVGELLGRGLAVASLLRAANRTVRGTLPDLALLRATARRHYRYPLYSVPSSIIDSALTLVPLPAIAALYGLHAAGVYALIHRIVTLPLGLFGQAIADTYHTDLAHAHRDRSSQLYAHFLRTARLLAALGVLVVVVMIAVGLTILEPLLGSSWEGAGMVMAILAPSVAAQLAVSPLSRVVFVLGGQGMKFAYDVFAVVLAGAAIAAAVVLELTFLQFVAALTGAQILGRIVYMVVLRRLVMRSDAISE